MAFVIAIDDAFYYYYIIISSSFSLLMPLRYLFSPRRHIIDDWYFFNIIFITLFSTSLVIFFFVIFITLAISSPLFSPSFFDNIIRFRFQSLSLFAIHIFIVITITDYLITDCRHVISSLLPHWFRLLLHITSATCYTLWILLAFIEFSQLAIRLHWFSCLRFLSFLFSLRH